MIIGSYVPYIILIILAIEDLHLACARYIYFTALCPILDQPDKRIVSMNLEKIDVIRNFLAARWRRFAGCMAQETIVAPMRGAS